MFIPINTYLTHGIKQKTTHTLSRIRQVKNIYCYYIYLKKKQYILYTYIYVFTTTIIGYVCVLCSA